MALALALTVGADTFLLLLDRWYLAGVLLFFWVQIVYLFRIARLNGGRPILLARLALTAALLGLLLALKAVNPVTTACALYLAHFICNLGQSLFLQTRGGRLFFWGLLLYFLCDLCVGMYNLGGLFPAPTARLAGFGMWLFYLPGQVLIVLSGLTQGETEYEAK